MYAQAMTACVEHKVVFLAVCPLHRALTLLNLPADSDTGLVDMLADDFPKARILSVSWNSPMFAGNTHVQDWRSSGNMVVTGLVSAGVGQRPAVFIGHSMGGLMMKQVVVDLQARSASSGTAHSLLHSLRSVVFIATPHNGSRLADQLLSTGRLGSVLGCAPSPLVSKLQMLANEPAFLSADYLTAIRGVKLSLPPGFPFSYGLCETLPLEKTVLGMRMTEVVVSRASACCDMDNDLVLVKADHEGIACPRDRKGMYASLRPHLQGALECAPNLMS